MIGTRRQMIKGFVAVGAAVASAVLGVVPEAAAVIRRGAGGGPWWASVPIHQEEVKGLERDAVLQRFMEMPDFQALINDPSDVDRASAVLVRNHRPDSRTMYSLGAPLYSGGILGMYALDDARQAAAAFVYGPPEQDGSSLAKLKAWSQGGRAMSMVESRDSCGPNTTPCSVCDDLDWGGVLECCGPCVFAGPALPACALAWCYVCYLRH